MGFSDQKTRKRKIYKISEGNALGVKVDIKKRPDYNRVEVNDWSFDRRRSFLCSIVAYNHETRRGYHFSD